LILFPKAKVDVLAFFMILTLPAFLVLGIWIGLQVFDGFGAIGATGGGIAYWAHIGGFVAGIVGIGLIIMLKGTPRNWPNMPNPEVEMVNPWAKARR